jgi:hypothetical protein
MLHAVQEGQVAYISIVDLDIIESRTVDAEERKIWSGIVALAEIKFRNHLYHCIEDPRPHRYERWNTDQLR